MKPIFFQTKFTVEGHPVFVADHQYESGDGYFKVTWGGGRHYVDVNATVSYSRHGEVQVTWSSLGAQDVTVTKAYAKVLEIAATLGGPLAIDGVEMEPTTSAVIDKYFLTNGRS